jgi:uncharacterized protein
MTDVRIDRLWHYPVKSMQGEEVDEISLHPGGVAGDRAYGFVDVETGRLASAKRPKRFGALLDCRARFVAPPAADAPPPPVEVTFPDGAVVTGNDAELTRRVSELLGREVRLISTVPDGLALDELLPEMEELPSNRLVDALDTGPADAAGDRYLPIPVAMAAPGTMLDFAALHILSAETLHRLAAAHPEGEWNPRRMRPNMVIDAGDEPADEDEWMGCDLHIGAEAIIHVVGPTPRCVMTTLAQPGLSRDPKVLRTIAQLGTKPMGQLGQFACAGSYAEVVTPGVVRRGDAIRIERVQPRQGALAATIDMMSAALAADS